MSCQKVLDFVAPPGADAHMSFYWTMDEGGAADKVDSTAALVWPLVPGTLAAPGLFSNGTDLDPLAFAQHGLRLLATPDITITQATSTGLSFWFWIKIVSYGTLIRFILDTSDPMHSNLINCNLSWADALNGGFTLSHANDLPGSVQVVSPNLTWSLGAWHMIAWTYNKTAQTLNIYIDGALAATTADTRVYPDLTNSNFTFQEVNFGVGLEVVIDEFGMSTKGPLTPAQVTSLYNGGAGVTWPAVQAIVPYP